ncbi:hypothetical protein RRF57_008413 [Xylaria bambusicola]|uniref:Uncharacterized protein n=1 Tax=Xylaria bambusicola TaxID=326684 RepID=A0AAN7UXJ0_9PEZI
MADNSDHPKRAESACFHNNSILVYLLIIVTIFKPTITSPKSYLHTIETSLETHRFLSFKSQGSEPMLEEARFAKAEANEDYIRPAAAAWTLKAWQL